MSDETAPKLSPVEGHKSEGRYLRGTLAEEIADPAIDHLSDANKSLIKFHGSYQQEDRDARKKRAKAGVGKAYMFMIRLKLPGGKLTADQYLTMDDIAGQYANGTLRITTRQSFQFHGVLKGNLKATMAAINDSLVTTLGGCGDVNRNVLSCPAPLPDPTRAADAGLPTRSRRTSRRRPARSAYHEIWLNGEQLPATPGGRGAEPGSGRADLRADVPAAEVQGGVLAAGRQLHRHPRAVPRLPGDQRERQADRLQPVRGRRAGADEPQPGHVPAARAAGLLHRPGRSGGGVGSGHQAVPRPRQPEPTASGRG